MKMDATTRPPTVSPSHSAAGPAAPSIGEGRLGGATPPAPPARPPAPPTPGGGAGGGAPRRPAALALDVPGAAHLARRGVGEIDLVFLTLFLFEDARRPQRGGRVVVHVLLVDGEDLGAGV